MCSDVIVGHVKHPTVGLIQKLNWTEKHILSFIYSLVFFAFYLLMSSSVWTSFIPVVNTDVVQ